MRDREQEGRRNRDRDWGRKRHLGDGPHPTECPWEVGPERVQHGQG